MLDFITELEEKQLNYAKYVKCIAIYNVYRCMCLAADKTKRITENSEITVFNYTVSDSM